MQKSSHKNKHHNHDDIDLLEDLDQIKQLLSATVRDFKGKTAEVLSQKLDNVKERSVDLRDNTANYISERPFATIGIAMLSGVLLGFLLKGRNSD